MTSATTPPCPEVVGHYPRDIADDRRAFLTALEHGVSPIVPGPIIAAADPHPEEPCS